MPIKCLSLRGSPCRWWPSSNSVPLQSKSLGDLVGVGGWDKWDCLVELKRKHLAQRSKDQYVKLCDELKRFKRNYEHDFFMSFTATPSAPTAASVVWFAQFNFSRDLNTIARGIVKRRPRVKNLRKSSVTAAYQCYKNRGALCKQKLCTCILLALRVKKPVA